MIDLSGRRGLVMGVSGPNSTGFHIARTLLAWGAEVAVTHRPEHRDAGIDAADRLNCHGHYAVDAGDEASMASAFADLGTRWPRLDFLVHTLAHVPADTLTRPVTQLRRAQFDAVLGVSVYSMIAAAGLAAPMLSRSDAARIVTLTSDGDRHAIPGYHVLGIAKAALAAAVRYVAQDLGPQGVLCNALRFSLVPTDGAVRALGAEPAKRAVDRLRAGALTGSATSIDQVATMTAIMASPLWQNITGEVITQDGGFAHTYLAPRSRRPETT